jgi:hypothetical protein
LFDFKFLRRCHALLGYCDIDVLLAVMATIILFSPFNIISHSISFSFFQNIANARALDEEPEGVCPPGGGRAYGRRARLCAELVYPGGGCAPRRALQEALQQGPVHAQVGVVSEKALSQQQVPLHGQGWEGHGALNHYEKSKSKLNICV